MLNLEILSLSLCLSTARLNELSKYIMLSPV
jgi:hypothetical protein